MGRSHFHSSFAPENQTLEQSQIRADTKWQRGRDLVDRELTGYCECYEQAMKGRIFLCAAQTRGKALAACHKLGPNPSVVGAVRESETYFCGQFVG